MQEFWKDIPNYEGFYQASNLGRIRNRKQRILSQSDNGKGYLRLNLCKNKTWKHI